jgi:hypothetical protein
MAMRIVNVPATREAAGVETVMRIVNLRATREAT